MVLLLACFIIHLPAANVGFVNTTFQVTEGINGSVSVCILLQQSSLPTVVVDVITVDGSATGKHVSPA